MAEVEIVDFSGMKEKKGVSFNEGGLMVALREATTRGGQELIHLGTFPYYNVGNILTLLSHGRIQYKNEKDGIWSVSYKWSEVETDSISERVRMERIGQICREVRSSIR